MSFLSSASVKPEQSIWLRNHLSVDPQASPLRLMFVSTSSNLFRSVPSVASPSLFQAFNSLVAGMRATVTSNSIFRGKIDGSERFVPRAPVVVRADLLGGEQLLDPPGEFRAARRRVSDLVELVGKTAEIGDGDRRRAGAHHANRIDRRSSRKLGQNYDYRLADGIRGRATSMSFLQVLVSMRFHSLSVRIS